MNNETKNTIVESLKKWLSENNFLEAEFCKKYDFPKSYINRLMNGFYDVETGSKKNTVIADSFYYRISKIIGLDIYGGIKWIPRQTPQFMQVISYLEEAKEFGYTRIIIGESGCGKSYTSDLFVSKSPKDTFKITVGSTDTISDLLDKILEVLKLPQTKSKSKKIGEIIKKFKEMHFSGSNPALIFDESEYMKQPTLCNIKELIDHLKNYCALILLGTNQLQSKLVKLKLKDKDGMPQFYSRIKFNIRKLEPINTLFNDFLDDMEDRSLVKFLQRECDSYRELSDALLPSMREAERLEEPLTEDLVRKVLNLPKRNV